MNKPRIVAIVLWALGVLDGIRQGISLPQQASAHEAFGSFGVMALLLPVAFFTTAPLWMKGHPFDLKRARLWINKNFGEETYESYTRAIKPLALFAAVATAIGLVGLASSVVAKAAPGAYAIVAFFLSCAAGFIGCRVILLRQGNTIE